MVQNCNRRCRKAVELPSFEISKTTEERPSVARPNVEVILALRNRLDYISAAMLYHTIFYVFYECSYSASVLCLAQVIWHNIRKDLVAYDFPRKKPALPPGSKDGVLTSTNSDNIALFSTWGTLRHHCLSSKQVYFTIFFSCQPSVVCVCPQQLLSLCSDTT